MLQRLHRRYPKLLWLTGAGILGLMMTAVIVAVPPQPWSELVVLLGAGGSGLCMAALGTQKKKWWVALPLWIIGGLIMQRLGILDLGIGIVYIGVLGIVAFFN